MIRQRSMQRIRGPQRALIVGIRRGRMPRRQMERSLDELARLVETARGTVVGRTSQEIKRTDPSTFIGKGKVEEIGRIVKDVGAELVVIDDELSPVQNRNLESRLGVLVLDRTALILDIFALRAKSREGKLQVELAQLEYLAPRLVGRGLMLSQQVGRIGTRGPGETALEYDRRRIRNRITFLSRNLEHVRSHRRIHRLKREAVPVPLISLVGYTNSGKTTLLNALTGACVFVEDKLFATLDPTVRRLNLPSGREVLIADTVGFIRRLPHELVESFKSTLEEIGHAKLLLHVIDGADEEAHLQVGVVEGVLADLGLTHKPRINIINKCDLLNFSYRGDDDSICISALAGRGIDKLLTRLDEMLRVDFRRTILKLPLNRGDILSNLYKLGYVRRVDYKSSGILIDCELHQKYYSKYGRYAVSG